MWSGRSARTASRRYSQGQGHHHLARAHQQASGQPPKKPAVVPEADAQQEGQRGGQNAGQQRYLAAVKEAGEDIAAVAIRSQQEEDARRVHGQQPAAHEEAHGEPLRRILAVIAGGGSWAMP